MTNVSHRLVGQDSVMSKVRVVSLEDSELEWVWNMVQFQVWRGTVCAVALIERAEQAEATPRAVRRRAKR